MFFTLQAFLCYKLPTSHCAFLTEALFSETVFIFCAFDRTPPPPLSCSCLLCFLHFKTPSNCSKIRPCFLLAFHISCLFSALYNFVDLIHLANSPELAKRVQCGSHGQTRQSQAVIRTVKTLNQKLPPRDHVTAARALWQTILERNSGRHNKAYLI